jgi:hypothetical protein
LYFLANTLYEEKIGVAAQNFQSGETVNAQRVHFQAVCVKQNKAIFHQGRQKKQSSLGL